MTNYASPSGSNPWDTFGRSFAPQPAAAPSSSGGTFGNAGTGYDQYNPYILSAANKYGVDPAYIKAVMSVESGGNAKAVSSAGARGLMQVMPFWASNGQDLFDPSTNIDMGTKILSSYYKQSKGDWNQALARYNGTWGKAAGQSYAQKVLGNLPKYQTSGNTTTSTQSSSGSLASAINYAKGQVGYDTYQNGVQMNLNDPKPKVTDCSGLVQWSYNKAGIKLPRTAYLQYNATQRINRQDLKPGDLIFFKNTYNAQGQKGNTQNISHVGIYMGNGQMVNSTGSQGRGTVIQSIDTPFWTQHLAGYGRVNGQNAGAAAPATAQPAAAPQKSRLFEGVIGAMQYSPFGQQNSDIYNTNW